MKYLPLLVLLLVMVACGGSEPVVSPVAISTPYESVASATAQSNDMEEEKDEEVVVVITGHAPLEFESGSEIQVTESQPIDLFFGDGTIEEKIVRSDAVVRATLGTLVNEVTEAASGKYRIALKFTFTVHEYLKGTGADSIVVYWVDGREYETSAAATADKPRITSWRDSQWDDREAILFLYDDHSHLEDLGSGLDAKLADANTFLISVGKQYIQDDNYSLYSERWRVWLPLSQCSRPVFETGCKPGVSVRCAYFERRVKWKVHHYSTITLADLKTLIASINTAVSSSSDPVAYTECLQTKYLNERMAAFHETQGRTDTDMFGRPHIVLSTASGQPAGTLINAELGYGVEGFTERSRMWLEGGDAELFTVTEGPEAPYTGTEELEPGTFTFDFQFRTARPLAVRRVRGIKGRDLGFLQITSCAKYRPALNWTVTVTAPSGNGSRSVFRPHRDGFYLTGWRAAASDLHGRGNGQHR